MARCNKPEYYLAKEGAVKSDRSYPGNRWTWIRFPYIGDRRTNYITYQWHLYDFTIKWKINYHSAPGPHKGRRKFYLRYYRMMNWAKCGLKGREEETEFLRDGRCPPGTDDCCPVCKGIWLANHKKHVFKEKKIDNDPEAWYNLN